MIKLAFINFIRSNSVRIGILFILMAGMVSLVVGKQFTQLVEKHSAEASELLTKHMVRYAEYNKDDIGLLLYYIKFSIINQMHPLNGLSIGQRDVNPSVKSITIRALEAQKYDADLNNPYNLLIGSIDFNFVLVFLIPLLIISFTYNLIAEEKESGTWKIVLVQSKNPLIFILKLYAIRFLVVLSSVLLILFLAVPFLQINFDLAFVSFVLACVLYVLVWFLICFWITSLGKNSKFNAVALLSIWILLVLIVPAAVNNYLQNSFPVPEAIETTLVQRKGYHEKWDMDKNLTMRKFYNHYPQFKSYTLPEAEFSWLLYYAMQQAGDDEAAEASKEFTNKLKQREQSSQLISLFIPTLHMQQQLNLLAKSGLGNQLNFLEATAHFHEDLRLYFYPKIFSEAPVSSEDWKSFKPIVFDDKNKYNPIQLYSPMVLFGFVFMILGWFNVKKNIHRA